RQLGIGVAGVHAHVAQLGVASQQRHDVRGQVLQYLRGVADQGEVHALALVARAARPADADLGPRRLRQALADLLLDLLADLQVVDGQVQAGVGPALLAVAAVHAIDLELLAVGVDERLHARHLAAHLVLGVGALPLIEDVDLVRGAVVTAALALADGHEAGQGDQHDAGHAPAAVL